MASSSALPPAARLQQRIPLIYRLLFLWFEPVAAFGGTVLALGFPDDYLATMTPRAVSVAATAPQFQVVFDQLAATYLLFAFNEAVVLRMTSELRVWKAMLFGIACCDVVHLYATGQALGGFHVLVSPTLWRSQDWLNLFMLYMPLTLRLSFCLGIGIAGDSTSLKKTA